MNRTIRPGALVFYLFFSLTFFWAVLLHLRPGPALSALAALHPAAGAGVLGLVLLNLGLRFARWHFLLRKTGVRLPTRESLHLFLAGTGLILTPLYAGEAFKPYVLKLNHGVPLRHGLAVVVWERYLDLLALTVLALLDLEGVRYLGAWAVLAAAAGGPALLAAFFPGALERGLRFLGRLRFYKTGPGMLAPSAQVFAALLARPVFLQAAGASLLAWLAAGAAFALLLAGTPGPALPLPQAAGAYAAATLAGAATLLPGGIGAMEATLLRRLEGLGEAAPAWGRVLLTRLLTLWFAVLLGGVILLWRYRRFLGLPVPAEPPRFETLAPVYDAELPPHMRAHYLARKGGLMVRALAAGGLRGGVGLDVGCGTGWHAAFLAEAGYRVVGLDRARGQLRQFRTRAGPAAVQADALKLPFRNRAFDFAYAINVLHHLPDRVAQGAALAEIHRVLRPGSLFFLHEINVRNPLVRFYMVFVFPVLKNIDEGTEHWLSPQDHSLFAGFEPVELHYYTFLPDFLPRLFLRPLRPMERLLERSPLAPWSAHFTLVLRRR